MVNAERAGFNAFNYDKIWSLWRRGRQLCPEKLKFRVLSRGF